MLPALLMPALLGGGAGLLLNRKDPLKGALLGAGLGAAGGAFAPGLFGGAAGAAEAAAPAMETGAFLGEGVPSGVAAWDAAVPGAGLFGQLKTAGEALAPVATAASAANAVGGLFGNGGQQMPAPTPMPVNSTGGQTLAQLAQAGQQQAASEMQAADQARKARRKGLLGGVYG